MSQIYSDPASMGLLASSAEQQFPGQALRGSGGGFQNPTRTAKIEGEFGLARQALAGKQQAASQKSAQGFMGESQTRDINAEQTRLHTEQEHQRTTDERNNEFRERLLNIMNGFSKEHRDAGFENDKNIHERNWDRFTREILPRVDRNDQRTYDLRRLVFAFQVGMASRDPARREDLLRRFQDSSQTDRQRSSVENARYTHNRRVLDEGLPGPDASINLQGRVAQQGGSDWETIVNTPNMDSPVTDTSGHRSFGTSAEKLIVGKGLVTPEDLATALAFTRKLNGDSGMGGENLSQLDNARGLAAATKVVRALEAVRDSAGERMMGDQGNEGVNSTLHDVAGSAQSLLLKFQVVASTPGGAALSGMINARRAGRASLNDIAIEGLNSGDPENYMRSIIQSILGDTNLFTDNLGGPQLRNLAGVEPAAGNWNTDVTSMVDQSGGMGGEWNPFSEEAPAGGYTGDMFGENPSPENAGSPIPQEPVDYSGRTAGHSYPRTAGRSSPRTAGRSR